MKKKLLMITFLSACATGAMAQSKFDGLYGQLGVGYEGISPYVTTSASYAGIGIPTSAAMSNSNSFVGTATIGYSFTLTERFILGIGAEFSPFAGQKESITYSVDGISAPGGTYNKKNSYNIFVSPGMAVGPDGVSYLKFGFTGMSANTSDITTNYTGYSLGLGYKQFLPGSGFYGFAEFNYASYGNKTYSDSAIINGSLVTASIKSSANITNVLVGLGYKF